MKVAIIGAGAAGVFCAIELKRRIADAEVDIYEAGSRPLVKLGLTGGGRCNLTNSFDAVDRLDEIYPRGARLMKRALSGFSQWDTMKWFEHEGVKLLVQKDGRVFPKSGRASQIVDTLLMLSGRLGVRIHCSRKLQGVAVAASQADNAPRFHLSFADGTAAGADAVVISTGGTGSARLKEMLPAGVEVVPTVPSLFTFKVNDTALRSLMGISVPDVILTLAGTRFSSAGELLLTDWGVSGPAVLRLSSYAARHLAEQGYRAALAVNWVGSDEESARTSLAASLRDGGNRLVVNNRTFGLPARLWSHLCVRAGVPDGARCADLAKKSFNRLVSTLTADSYQISGRAAFKEEFVTCGGVDLKGVNPSTMESRVCPGLFFAGEVLDIDAVTGGFNLQAAWSTSMAAAEGIASFFL